MRHALVPLLAVFGAACTFVDDFDSLRGAPDGSTTAGGPVATIDFPPPGVTGASSITIRGTAVDLEGDGVGEVRVGDVVATLAADGSFSVNVPLAPGENELVVTTVDSGGATNEAAASVTVVRHPALRSLSGLALDAGNARLIANDGTLVVSIDLDTMEVHAVSDDVRGTGTPLVGGSHLAMEADGDTVLVGSSYAITAVDVGSGERVAYASDSIGTGSAFTLVRDLALDPAANRVLVASSTALWAIDRTTRDRTVLSSTSVGTGPVLSLLDDVTADEAPGSALVVDLKDGSPSVLRVTLTSGDRAVLSDASHGSGPLFEGFAIHAALDAANDRLMVAGGFDDGVDGEVYGVLAVDLATGDRTLVSGPGVGAGPALEAPRAIVVDEGGDRAIVLDRGGARLVSVDLTDGERSVLLDLLAVGAGSGPRESAFQYGLALDPAGERALVSRITAEMEGFVGSLAAVDLATGDRTILSGAGTGDGDPIAFPTMLDLDAARGRALMVEILSKQVYAVDLATGDRSIFSGEGVEFGVALSAPVDLAVHAAGDRALLIDAARVVSIGLATGTRVELSGPDSGLGVSFSVPRGVAIDTARDRALVTDICLEADASCEGSRVLSVDLTTGARSILSDSTHGSGPGLIDAQAIAMSGDRAIVVDGTLHAVISVDLVDGHRAIIARPGLETGVALDSLGAMDVDPERGWALLANGKIGGTTVVDLVTGETIALSY